MNLYRMVKVLIGALSLSLFRYKLGTYNLELYLKKYNVAYPADWGAFVFMMIFASVMSIGISVEEPLSITTGLILNIYILVIYTFFAVIILSLLIRRFINPNISLIIDKIPIHPFKTFIVKLSVEAFDYKIIILISQIILIPIFNYYYDLPNKIESLGLVYFILFNTYFFSCQVSLFVKKVAYSKVARFTFNKIRIIILIFAIPIYLLADYIEMDIIFTVSYIGFMFIILSLNILFFIFLKHFELSR